MKAEAGGVASLAWWRWQQHQSGRKDDSSTSTNIASHDSLQELRKSALDAKEEGLRKQTCKTQCRANDKAPRLNEEVERALEGLAVVYKNGLGGPQATVAGGQEDG